MKSLKLFHGLMAIVLFIVFFSAVRVVRAQSNFDPNLKKALDLVVAQRDETQDAMRQLRNKLRGSKNPPFTPDDPSLKGRYGPVFNDIGVKFNQVIATVKDGDSTAVSTAQENIIDGVDINHGFIREANLILSASLQEIDVAGLKTAWQTILQASQTPDKKLKKNLYKYLQKNAIWKMWTEL